MTTRLKLQIERDGAQVVSIDITGDDAVVSALLATASEEQGKARFRDEFNGHALTAPSVEVPAGLMRTHEEYEAQLRAAYQRGLAEALDPAAMTPLEEDDHEHEREKLDDGSEVCAECGEVLAAEEDQA